jgi:hypothetical protein
MHPMIVAGMVTASLMHRASPSAEADTAACETFAAFGRAATGIASAGLFGAATPDEHSARRQRNSLVLLWMISFIIVLSLALNSHVVLDFIGRR